MTEEQYEAHQRRVKTARPVKVMGEAEQPGPKVNKVCPACGKEFQTYFCLRDRKKYCSKACMDVARKPVPKPCEACGEEILGRGKIFCSIKCRAAVKVGPAIHNWRGGDHVGVCAGCGKEYTFKAAERGLVCSLKCWGKVKVRYMEGRTHSRSRGGKRADLGGQYFRSAWEANWARYLNWLKDRGELRAWSFEPETFEFAGIKRGSRFYTPDFRIEENNGRIVYHEIKGWMDKVSATKLRRMRKYHPGVTILLIDKPAYRAVSTKMKSLISGWEITPRKQF